MLARTSTIINYNEELSLYILTARQVKFIAGKLKRHYSCDSLVEIDHSDCGIKRVFLLRKHRPFNPLPEPKFPPYFVKTAPILPPNLTSTLSLETDQTQNVTSRVLYLFTPVAISLCYTQCCCSGEAKWSPGRFRDGRKYRTLSTTEKPVRSFYCSRQRLLLEPAFVSVLSSVVQEWACDQYLRTDELRLSCVISRQLPEQRLTTKNVFGKTVGKRLPASFHGSHVNGKMKTIRRDGRCRAHEPPNLEGHLFWISGRARSPRKPVYGQT